MAEREIGRGSFVKIVGAGALGLCALDTLARESKDPFGNNLKVAQVALESATALSKFAGGGDAALHRLSRRQFFQQMGAIGVGLVGFGLMTGGVVGVVDAGVGPET